ncbi:nickel pincer cofactor biosynthesis protein LarB [Actinopolymorpha sp. B17G11]|uniref:nickel pincer cofactor biosynthesis protein LarB n=1 Tax=Actinopolymorpha sp. B17G11 TaxID=3160861 RepID=UPI0032E4548E
MTSRDIVPGGLPGSPGSPVGGDGQAGTRNGTTEPAPVDPGYVDLGYARLDTDRLSRTGDPEVVYGAGKSPAQVVDLLRALRDAHPGRAALATRLDADAITLIRSAFPDARIDETARAATVGPLPEPTGMVCVVAAGTSDARVAAEAAFTVQSFGGGVHRISDVGVAGVHRLLDAKDQLDAADCLIVVAGMEGALPSVVGGLTGVPLVAVPTSVGYGASFGGVAALLAMLNSCAPGVVVSNIDNGFGAGVFAARVARRAGNGQAVSHQATDHQATDHRASDHSAGTRHPSEHRVVDR